MKTHLKKRRHPYVRIGLIVLIIAVVLIALLKRARAEELHSEGLEEVAALTEGRIADWSGNFGDLLPSPRSEHPAWKG